MSTEGQLLVVAAPDFNSSEELLAWAKASQANEIERNKVRLRFRDSRFQQYHPTRRVWINQDVARTIEILENAKSWYKVAPKPVEQATLEELLEDVRDEICDSDTTAAVDKLVRFLWAAIQEKDSKEKK